MAENKASGPVLKQILLKDRKKAIEVPEVLSDTLSEPEVDVDDIQGDSLCGFNKTNLAILAIEITPDGALESSATIKNAKKWLADYVIPKVSSARDVMQFRQLFRMMRERLGFVKPSTVAQICYNVSFSYDALLRLAPDADVEKFDKMGVNDGFFVGLPFRSTFLSDPTTGIGANENWIVGAKKNPDILLQIASDRKSLIEEEIALLEAGLTSLGNPANITYKEFGNRRPDLPGHEHFGFLDGISQPGPRGWYKTQITGRKAYITPRTLHETDPRNGYTGLPGQRLIWPGEFILGLPKQKHDAIHLPGDDSFAGPEWAKNGTFLVYRRLRQDVPKFWKFLKESAATIAKQPGVTDFTKEKMGAKVMARWISGAPVIRQPSEDDPDLGKNRFSNNAFVYKTEEDSYKLKPHGNPDDFPTGSPDPFGRVCPLSAHLRKINPRDSPTDVGGIANNVQHLIIRRGIEYGEVIEDVMVDDEKDRGLMFICYQKSIDQQFEFLIKWANHAKNPHSGGGHDMVIGQSNAKDRERVFDVPLPNDNKVTLKTTDEWVIPTGGGYFFVPSISALKNIIAKE